jgi:hypothetical protein
MQRITMWCRGLGSSTFKSYCSEKEGLIKYGVSLSLGTKVDWQRRVCGLNLGEYNE